MIYIAAGAFSGGAVPELAAAGSAFGTATASISATGNVVAGSTLIIGTALGGDPEKIASAASATSAIATPAGVVTAMATGNMDVAGKASDAVSAVKLATNPGEAARNPADAALTFKGAKELIQSGIETVKSFLSSPGAPSAPAAPGRPSCSVAGAC